MREDGRAPNELRPVTIQRGYIIHAPGSALISWGNTRVLCTATVGDRIPPFLRNTGRGWITAEYAMLPGSANGGRVSRDASKKGRALEISRLIGRSMRSIADLGVLGERQIILDCDVIQADGGTRTASITAAYVALKDAIETLIEREVLKESPLTGQCAAVSIGMVRGEALLDLCYEEDAAADVDLNVVMNTGGGIIEVQGTAEGAPFSREDLDGMLDLGHDGIGQLFSRQNEAPIHDQSAANRISQPG